MLDEKTHVDYTADQADAVKLARARRYQAAFLIAHHDAGRAAGRGAGWGGAPAEVHALLSRSCWTGSCSIGWRGGRCRRDALTSIRYTGTRVKRLEDPRLLRGAGRFLDDLAPARHAHRRASCGARTRTPASDADRRRARPRAARRGGRPHRGRAAWPSSETARAVGRGRRIHATAWPILADGEVRYGGQPVAMIVAANAYAAADAREDVRVEYEPRPAIAALPRRCGGRGPLPPRGDARATWTAALPARRSSCARRFATPAARPSPMEPRGVMAEWDGETLTVHASTQSPSIFRAAVAASLGLATARVRVVVPDMGGGFGLKMQVFPEEVAVAAPRACSGDREVGGGAARESARRVAGAGGATPRSSWPRTPTGGCSRCARACAPTRAPTTRIRPPQVLEPLGTASDPSRPVRAAGLRVGGRSPSARTSRRSGAYRGVGMTMGAFVMERMLDLVAERLGLDPVEVRRRNLIPARGVSVHVDERTDLRQRGLSQGARAGAGQRSGTTELRGEQAKQRAAGRLVGIGLACYTEYTGMGSAVFRRRGMIEVSGIEAATGAVEPDGTVRCAVSFPSQGQGHATTVAQLVADRLGRAARARPARARRHLALGRAGSGTFGSRGTVAMVGSVGSPRTASREKIERSRPIAWRPARPTSCSPAGARSCGASPSAPERSPRSRGRRTRRRSAGCPVARRPGSRRPCTSIPPARPSRARCTSPSSRSIPTPGACASSGTRSSRTAGRVINPIIVDGQIHGAVAQGIGEALLRRLSSTTRADSSSPRR